MRPSGVAGPNGEQPSLGIPYRRQSLDKNRNMFHICSINRTRRVGRRGNTKAPATQGGSRTSWRHLAQPETRAVGTIGIFYFFGRNLLKTLDSEKYALVNASKFTGIYWR